jgi:Cu-Zn family superoxide dismutase
LTKNAEDTLQDGNDASLVIFEKGDDYISDPHGNAGARLACGIIAPAK